APAPRSVRTGRRQDRDECQREDQLRVRQQNVEERTQCGISAATFVAGDQTEQAPDEGPDDDRTYADQQRRAGAPDGSTECVGATAVGTEKMAGRERRCVRMEVVTDVRAFQRKDG